MTSTTNHHDVLIKRYLAHLNWTLRDLPPSRRNSLVEEITAHIQTARANMTEETEVEIRRVLDQVGDPETIRAEAGLPPISASWGDPWVPWLLLFGGFVAGVGWIFGVILLWRSSLWRMSDKILGTLLGPVLLVGGVGFGGLLTIGPPVATIIPILGLVVVVGGPILGVIRLLSVYRQATQGPMSM